MPQAALYVRVSTSDQHLDNQLPDTQQLAKARGWEIVETYAEKVSAVKVRPEFNRMLMDARRGMFEYVVVWSLDRFGRSMLGNLQTVIDLDTKGVHVVSVREPWLDNDVGHVRNLLLGIISWVGEQERLRLTERVRSGIERARRQGVRLGRPPAEIDLARALRLKADGGSLRGIASSLGCSTSALQRAIALSQKPLQFDPQKDGEI